MRVVIDTNVLISATLLQELKKVLKESPFCLEDEEIKRIEGSILEIAEIVEPHTKVQVCRDEADNRVLECAIEGKADYIITGDGDLLDLASFKGIKITKATDFLKYVEG